MAQSRNSRAAEVYSSRTAENREIYTYVEGTAVRQLEIAPEREQKRSKNTSLSTATKQNRERALQMNVGYVLFLTAAAVMTVLMCVNYLQLKAKETRLQKQVTSLETQLDSAILQNDSNYNRIMANVDMEHVREVATNELGIQYVAKRQIVTYRVDDNDYVRQYAEVPEE